MWGIDFTADMFLSRQRYNTKAEVEDKIKELEGDIANLEAKLQMFAVATPKDIITETDVDNAVSYLNFELRALFEEYHDYIYQKFQLELYLEYLNENKIETIKQQENE